MIEESALADTIEWLSEGGTSVPQADDALQELCEQLVRCGLPLAHGAIFARTLHPEIIGRRSGSRTCAASPPAPTACRRWSWSSC